ncbi:hypothetical protein VP417E501_P0014 [Vibrio phage 417E50-1]|nr:hypothetical protein VP417E501_P0014 [Vibrio phage 417E50-1]
MALRGANYILLETKAPAKGLYYLWNYLTLAKD